MDQKLLVKKRTAAEKAVASFSGAGRAGSYSPGISHKSFDAQTASNKTLPLALGQFKGEHSLDIPIILSVLVLSVLPMIVLFIIFQDKLVKGMMAGAVKG